MAYIQTTKRLIHVKESLQKLKNVIIKWQIDDKDWVGVTEVIPEINIQLKCDEFYARNKKMESEKLLSRWEKKCEQLERQNEKNSKGRKILIRVKDIMELHDEKSA